MIEKKLLLISHIADEDGITPIILSKIVFKNVDILLLNPGEVDDILLKNIEKYEMIHITDLGISEKLAKNIEEKYKDKVKLFDHHKTSEYLNKYSFATVIIKCKEKLESATSIYYKYLLKISDEKLLRKKSVKDLVEQVRIIDTYDFKTEKDKEAINLSYLFGILGRQNYVEYFKNYIKENNSFKYGEREKFLIKLQKDKVNNYLTQKEKEIIFANVDGYKVVIVYAETNRSELGNYLVNKYDVDFSIIINIPKGISYRGNGKVDLSEYALRYKGGGHKNASGSPIPKEILKKITENLFKEIKIKEEM